jgi:hypothetical protein
MADREDATLIPIAPQEYLTMNEQLMYKLASLDQAVQGGFRRLDEKMDRFQHDLHEGQIQTNDRISELDKEFTAAIRAKRERIDNLVKESEIVKAAYEKRMVALETWREVAVAKVTMVTATVVGLWTLVAPAVRSLLGISNG